MIAGRLVPGRAGPVVRREEALSLGRPCRSSCAGARGFQTEDAPRGASGAVSPGPGLPPQDPTPEAWERPGGPSGPCSRPGPRAPPHSSWDRRGPRLKARLRASRGAVPRPSREPGAVSAVVKPGPSPGEKSEVSVVEASVVPLLLRVPALKAAEP